MEAITIHNLKKYFTNGPHETKAIDDINLSIEKGSFTAITGASGSGKTTLLNIIGGLYAPTSGSIFVDGYNLNQLSEEQLSVFRRRKVGFIFQDDNLVPELTIRENILFPLALDASRPDVIFFRKIISLLDLSGRLEQYPHMLSGGWQQCVAIARAFITKPSIVLADEPTGHLDVKNGQNIAGILKMLTQTFHQTLILSTHNLELAHLADYVIRLQDGRIVNLGQPNPPL